MMGQWDNHLMTERDASNIKEKWYHSRCHDDDTWMMVLDGDIGHVNERMTPE